MFARARPGVADLRGIALALLAGSCVLHLLPQLPPWWVYAPAGLLFLLLWPVGRLRWLWLAFVLGALWSHWHADAYLQVRFTPVDDGQTRWVTGWIASLPQQDKRRSEFLLQPLADSRRLIRVNDYGRHDFAAGSCQRLKLRLHAPRALANPGSFDTAGWAYRSHLTAMAYVRKRGACTALERAQIPWLASGWLQLRAAVVRRVTSVLHDSPVLGPVLSLTLGAVGDVTQAQWQTLRRTGTTHLLSVSGFHIAVVAGWVFWLLRWLWPRWPRLALYCPAPRAAAIGALLAAVFYAALAGFSVPTQRSLIMAGVMLGAVALGRHLRYSRVFALALVLVLLHDSTAVMQPGFWLSFMAIGWIAWLMSNRVGKPGRWMTWFGLQLAIAVVLAPVLLHLFGQTSMVAPVANLFMLPLFALLVPALMLSVLVLCLLPVFGAPLLLLSADLLDWVWRLLAWLGNLPAASAAGSAALLATVLAVAGLVWLTAPRGTPVRWLGLVLCVPLLAASHTRLPEGVVQLTLLDVGQGLSAFLRTRNHTLLFDTGPAGPGYDSGRSVVLPFLHTRRVSRLDSIVVSHKDRDHSGGLHSILAAMPVAKRWGALGGQPCHEGEGWQWDGVTFRFLYPGPAVHSHKSNAHSCVLRVSVPGHALLLTGDIEAAGEQEILAQEQDQLPADVLVIAHHGSCTSSSKSFLAAVRPLYALIPVGWHNRYHHPCGAVVKRLLAAHIQVYSTAREGALQLRLSADGVSHPDAWRNAYPRFWRWPATPVTAPARSRAHAGK